MTTKRNFIARHKILTAFVAIFVALWVLGTALPKKPAVKTAAKPPAVTPARPRPSVPATTTEPPATVAPPTTASTTTEPATIPPPPPTTTASRPPAAPRPTVAPPTTTAATLPPAVDVVALFKSQTQRVTVSQLANFPRIYDGTAVFFAATIGNFVPDANGWSTGMNVLDPNDSTSVIDVALAPFVDVTQMNKGDALTIWAHAVGTITGKNAFGATITESSVNEVYLLDTTTGYSAEIGLP